MVVRKCSSNTADRFRSCCEALEFQRNQRNMLKYFLSAAKRDELPGWISFLSAPLDATRKRVQRLSAQKSRLSRRIAT